MLPSHVIIFGTPNETFDFELSLVIKKIRLFSRHVITIPLLYQGPPVSFFWKYVRKLKIIIIIIKWSRILHTKSLEVKFALLNILFVLRENSSVFWDDALVLRNRTPEGVRNIFCNEVTILNLSDVILLVIYLLMSLFLKLL